METVKIPSNVAKVLKIKADKNLGFTTRQAIKIENSLTFRIKNLLSKNKEIKKIAKDLIGDDATVKGNRTGIIFYDKNNAFEMDIVAYKSDLPK